MSAHPLIELANDREVRQAKGFRQVAADLNGEALEERYQRGVSNAPKRHEVGKKYLVGHTAKRPNGRRNGRDDEHLSIALWRRYAEGEGATLDLPDGKTVRLLDCQLPLRTAQADKERGNEDPNAGVGVVDLLGILPDGRLAVVDLKFLPPQANRGGTGDTPLRALLQTLGHTAIVDANREAIQSELGEAGGQTISEEAPALILLASPRYWELCRKREAQKGAAWIREFERLARESAQEIGVEVWFLALELEGDPGWEYDAEGPLLDADAQIVPAWEAGAGKLKPKPKPKPKAEEDPLVEADLSREIRPYALHECFEVGDRIDHSTLGLGVVQSEAGAGKIIVLFGDRKVRLVHQRAVSA